jgi:hypothetical protein
VGLEQGIQPKNDYHHAQDGGDTFLILLLVFAPKDYLTGLSMKLGRSFDMACAMKQTQ